MVWNVRNGKNSGISDISDKKHSIIEYFMSEIGEKDKKRRNGRNSGIFDISDKSEHSFINDPTY